MSVRKRRADQRAAHQARQRRNGIIAVVVIVVLVASFFVATQLTSGGSAPAAAADLRACPTASVDPAANAGDLPDQTLDCLGDGPAVNFASLTGKPTILNVWASWCPPCVAELPWIAELDDQAKDQVQVIGIDVNDERDSALSMLASAGVHYPVVFDPEGRTRATLGWAGTPMTLFIRPDGTVAHRVDGRLPDASTLRQLAQQYLGVSIPG